MVKIIKIQGCSMCPNIIVSQDTIGICNCGLLISVDIEEGKTISEIDGSLLCLPDCPLEDYKGNQ
jgi:hypothetical protein